MMVMMMILLNPVHINCIKMMWPHLTPAYMEDVLLHLMVLQSWCIQNCSHIIIIVRILLGEGNWCIPVNTTSAVDWDQFSPCQACMVG